MADRFPYVIRRKGKGRQQEGEPAAQHAGPRQFECKFEHCHAILNNETVRSHYILHCKRLETEDLPEGCKKPRKSKRCPFCTEPTPYIAAANRVADHIVRNHHKYKTIVSLPCPAGCTPWN